MHSLKIATILFVAVVAMTTAYTYQPYSQQLIEEYPQLAVRVRRSPQENQDNDDSKKDEEYGWVFQPDIGRDEDGQTRAKADIEYKQEDYSVDAGYSKNLDGGQDSWHVGATFNWD